MIEIKVKPLSVNQAWQGKRYKTKDYKVYEKEVYFKLPHLNIPDGQLEIYLEFGLSNKQADWDNPIKPFIDILQFKYGFDDKRIYAATVKKTIVKKGQEYIKFKIKKMLELSS
jgi:Holliday junction resolvase RusA-like endonuclease